MKFNELHPLYTKVKSKAVYTDLDRKLIEFYEKLND